MYYTLVRYLIPTELCICTDLFLLAFSASLTRPIFCFSFFLPIASLLNSCFWAKESSSYLFMQDKLSYTQFCLDNYSFVFWSANYWHNVYTGLSSANNFLGLFPHAFLSLTSLLCPDHTVIILCSKQLMNSFRCCLIARSSANLWPIQLESIWCFLW